MANQDMVDFLIERLETFYLASMQEVGLSQEVIDEVKAGVMARQMEDVVKLSKVLGLDINADN